MPGYPRLCQQVHEPRALISGWTSWTLQPWTHGECCWPLTSLPLASASRGETEGAWQGAWCGREGPGWQRHLLKSPGARLLSPFRHQDQSYSTLGPKGSHGSSHPGFLFYTWGHRGTERTREGKEHERWSLGVLGPLLPYPQLPQPCHQHRYSLLGHRLPWEYLSLSGSHDHSLDPRLWEGLSLDVETRVLTRLQTKLGPFSKVGSTEPLC